ncbi:Protein terminal ear1 [Platanthera zijinensis]|uniref:Protein terminal ear1 n=1 Tax=Platanthera zijinensis TaxID=2320716 RepID=A0AAP0BTG6_9ASPA
MEGGIGGNLLDPRALEFYPANQFAGAAPAHIYYPYPPPTPSYHPQMQLLNALPNDGEPTRTVILTLLPRHVDAASATAAMEAFGAVRAVESAALASDGSATFHYYDLRSALAAVFEIREQHVRAQSHLGRQYGVVPANWGIAEWPPIVDPVNSASGRGLIAGYAAWAQFGARGAVDGPNQGSLFVSNCDPAVPSAYFIGLFGSLGDVKEIKETAPWKPRTRVVEFYDVRDAARAVSELHGREVYGRRLVVKFAWTTAGHSRRTSAAQQAEQPSSSGKKEERVAGDTVRNIAKNSNAGRGGGGGQREDRRAKVITPHKPAAAAAAAAGSAASSSSSSSTSSTIPAGGAAKQQLVSSRRGWKNHPRNGGDARFQFKQNTEGSSSSSSSASRDSRTTVMIKNIPNKYSQKLLLRMLDNHCIRCNEEIGKGEVEPFSAYDFVYLPIDFNNKCNVGYGFVNLTSPEAAVRLHRAFHMQPWEVFNSRKICQVNYARLQGLEALKEHFKNSKFACDTDEYMPVVFCPPRDGKELTEPVPVGGRGCAGLTPHLQGGGGGADYAEPQHLLLDAGGASSTTASTHAPSDNGDGVDDEDDDRIGGGGGVGSDETVYRLSQALRLSQG